MTALAPDHAKNADFMRQMVRVQNAIGLLCPIPWTRELLPAQRRLLLKERTRGLVLHDLTVRGEAIRLKVRLAAMSAAGKAIAPADKPHDAKHKFTVTVPRAVDAK